MRTVFFALLLVATVALAACSSESTGTLAFDANGEDFVREGFVSKDGWEIAFDNVIVTVDEVSAYQTEPPFDASTGEMPTSDNIVQLSGPSTLDLAAGPADADPIRVAEIGDAPSGQYNAMSWRMIPADSGPSSGATVYMVGTAMKDGETIDFTIAVNDEFRYACGEFVGDERKGILAEGDAADVEMTFHFDHIFGDGDAPLDDGLNVGALGFDPLAALAQDGVLEVDSADLQAGLSADEYATFFDTVATLGHVGEGHCYEAIGGYTGHKK